MIGSRPTAPQVLRTSGGRSIQLKLKSSSKRLGTRESRAVTVMRSLGARTTRVLKQLDRVIQAHRRAREQRSQFDDESSEDEMDTIDEMLKARSSFMQPHLSPPRTHRSDVLSCPPRHLSLSPSPSPSPSPPLSFSSTLSLSRPTAQDQSRLYATPADLGTDLGTDLMDAGPSRHFSLSPSLSPSPLLSRATAGVQSRYYYAKQRALERERREDIARMQRSYFRLQIRRYRGRPMPFPPPRPHSADAASPEDAEEEAEDEGEFEDLHLGFRPPSAADEQHLDVKLRLTLFNIMMKLGRKENWDVLEDAFVVRKGLNSNIPNQNSNGEDEDADLVLPPQVNVPRVDMAKEGEAGNAEFRADVYDGAGGSDANASANASTKIEDASEPTRESEILRLWNIFTALWTNFSFLYRRVGSARR